MLDRARPVLETCARRIFNTLLVLNQAAVADLLALAADLGVNVRLLWAALAQASGGQCRADAVRQHGHLVPAAHLSRVQTLDMDIFDTAVRDGGADPTVVSAWAFE